MCGQWEELGRERREGGEEEVKEEGEERVPTRWVKTMVRMMMMERRLGRREVS